MIIHFYYFSEGSLSKSWEDFKPVINMLSNFHNVETFFIVETWVLISCVLFLSFVHVVNCLDLHQLLNLFINENVIHLFKNFFATLWICLDEFVIDAWMINKFFRDLWFDFRY